MNIRTYIVTALALVFFISYGSASAVTTLITQQGGTGTTSPSGILYGDNGSTNHVNTVTIGTGCTFVAGTLACPGTGGSGSGTVSTSTNETAGALSYWTSNSATPALLGKVATTSHAFSGPFTITGTLGAVVGGSNSTVTWNGLATTSQPTLSQLLYSTGGAGVAGTPTTTASCAGSTSCTAFTILGSTPVTITGSGSGGTGLATTSPVSAGNLLEYSGVGSGSAFGVATGTISNGTNITVSGGPGYIVGSGITIGLSGTVAYANGGTGTTTAPISQLIYGGAIGYQSVGTSTLTASGPLTGSFTQVGSGGSLGCTTAASGVAGCLSNTSFDTFNLKQAPGFQIGTTSGIAISQLAYYTNTGTIIGGVATSSETCSSPLSCTAHTVLTGGGAISLGTVGYANGGTGTTTAPISQLLYGGASAYQSVATTSASCSGSVSCTAFTVLGASPITISGSGGGTGLSTTSPVASSNILYYNASGAGSATGVATTTLTLGTGLTYTGTLGALVGGASGTLNTPWTTTGNNIANNNSGNVGIGTTTPFGRLSISSTGQLAANTVLFDVASTTGADLFNIDATGAQVGTGTYYQFGSQPVLDTAFCSRSKQCWIHTGTDNTLSGVENELQNSSNGASAYGVYTIQNNLTDSSGTHYDSWSLNSSQYNDPTFGTFLNFINAEQHVNTDGPFLFQSLASTTALNYFAFATSTTLASEIFLANTYGFLVGTSTAQSKLDVQTQNTNGTALNIANAIGSTTASFSTNDAQANVFLVGSSTGQTYFRINQQGYVITAATGTPALSSCGTSPSVVGDALHFTITVGSVAATGCTATFPNGPLPSAPHCNVTNQSMSVVNAMTYTESTSAIVISQTGLTSNILDVNCSLSGQS